MDRTALIEDRLTQHFTDIGARPKSLSVEEWAALDPDPADSRRMLGVTAPQPVIGLGWVARFCPTLLARATAGLNDDDLDKTLTAVEWVLDAEVEYHTLSTEERIAAADAALFKIAEGSLRYLSEAQFAALDMG